MKKKKTKEGVSLEQSHPIENNTDLQRKRDAKAEIGIDRLFSDDEMSEFEVFFAKGSRSIEASYRAQVGKAGEENG